MPEVSPVTVLMESEGISSVVSRLPSIRHCGQRPSNESGRSAVPHLEQIRSLVFILLIPETNSVGPAARLACCEEQSKMVTCGLFATRLASEIITAG